MVYMSRRAMRSVERQRPLDEIADWNGERLFKRQRFGDAAHFCLVDDCQRKRDQRDGWMDGCGRRRQKVGVRKMDLFNDQES